MDAGWKVEDHPQFNRWAARVEAFLRMALGDDVAGEFRQIVWAESAAAVDWEAQRSEVMGVLEGIIARRIDTEQSLGSLAANPTARTRAISKRVFVVHGHDHGAKEMVARYLERLGLDADILHEKPSASRTLIEKLEAFSDVGFAVVLLTPDDVGAARAEAASLKPRARQNVILELGFFLGKLKRSRVCALYEPSVDVPSDYSGVVFIELDAKGAWRTQLAQELSNARLPINLEGLLGS